MEDYNKAISLNGKDVAIYFWRGRLYESQGKHEEAAKDYFLNGNLNYASDKYEVAVERYTSGFKISEITLSTMLIAARHI